MKKHQNESSDVKTTPAQEATPDPTRRRFVIASIAAAPLLVTLAARPAQAQCTNGTCGNYGSAIR